jgi:hypothetical protein
VEYRFSLIDPSGNATILDDEPIGWDASLFNIERDDFYKGLLFSYTADLEFINNGFQIIKTAYDTHGVDYILTLKVELQCDDSFEFETVYQGASNFALYQDTTSDYCSCKLPFDEVGPQMILKNRESNPVNLQSNETLDGSPMTDFTYGPYDLTTHSRALVLQSQLSAKGADIDISSVVPELDFLGNISIPFPYNLEFNELPTMQAYTNFYATGVISSSAPDSLFTATQSGVHTFEYNLNGVYDELQANARSYNLAISYRVNGLGTSIHNYGPVSGSGGSHIIQAFNLTGSLVLTLSPGDTVSFYIAVSGVTGGGANSTIDIKLLDGGYIKVSKETTTAATITRSFAIHEALAKLTQSIFNNQVSLYSSYYGRTNSEPQSYSKNGNGSFLAITNGYQLRGFPQVDRPIFVTLKDIFTSLNAIDCIGLGLEQKADGTYQLSIEPIEKLFQGTIFLYLGNVFELNRSVAEDRFYNELEIGYEKYGTEQGTDKTNTLDAFCAQHNYLIPQRSIKRKLEAKSIYVADQYSIELTRRNRYVDKATEQWEFDEDNFLICLNRTVNGSNVPTGLNVAEKDENFSAVTNTIDPSTSYNLRISPKRNFLKWAKIVNACIYKAAGATVKFGKGLLNYTMSSSSTDQTERAYNDQPLAENASIAWDDINNQYGAPIWSPEYYEFEYPLSWTQYKLIKNNPKSCIAFSHSDGDFIKGFI